MKESKIVENAISKKLIASIALVGHLDAHDLETWEATVSDLKIVAERLEALLTERKIRESGR